MLLLLDGGAVVIIVALTIVTIRRIPVAFTLYMAGLELLICGSPVPGSIG